MKKRTFIALLCAFLLTLPLAAVLDERNLAGTLHSLRVELQKDYDRIFTSQARIAEQNGRQHDRMIEIMQKCNELALMLYSQKQEYTFDLSYVLDNVTDEFVEFQENRMPYDQVVAQMDIEIERYSRLIESLRRLPPQLSDLDIKDLPDSLRYRNDSIKVDILELERQLGLEQDDIEEEDLDTFVLDEEGQLERDSCIFFATTLLKMYSANKDYIVDDSTHYENVYLRLKESYDYALERYRILQNRIFVQGQTAYPLILANFGRYWTRAEQEMKDHYGVSLVEWTKENIAKGEVDTESLSQWSGVAFTAYLLGFLFFLLVGMACAWLIVFLLPRLFKGLRTLGYRERRPGLVIALGFLLFAVVMMFTGETESVAEQADSLVLTYTWLVLAIVLSLLLHLETNQFRNGLRLYLPMILLAIVVIGFRMVFMPNTMMNILYPPILLVFEIWQLLACLREGPSVMAGDRYIAWLSLIVVTVALVISVLGYIFLSLLVMLWWFFQLACVETTVAIYYQLMHYKHSRMQKRVEEFRKSITFVTGAERDRLLFPATWFYDLVMTVLIPVLLLISIPLCLRLSLAVFDFSDLYNHIYRTPFFNLTDSSGQEMLRFSFYNIILAVGLFFVFRYAAKALCWLYRRSSYSSFLRKNGRSVVRSNEINLSLGTSVVNIVVWFVYIVILVLLLKIPTNSLSLVAGGLSAGIGLAMKDVLNNFIYGIQLMSGRLRVGDWIECDGVRGKVTSINYQSTQIETLDNTVMSFLNASLFAKNFTNLTRNNSYEFLKIMVGVAYGTDVEQVRAILEEKLQVLRTKDSYGREIVDPKYGIYVRFGNFGDSAVEIAVKQYILVAERVGYIDRAKEIIYKALNENGIQIPFPQRDIHIISADSTNDPI